MMSAKTNEQHHAFQHEIAFCQTEIRRIEDKVLELMEESERLDKNVKRQRRPSQSKRKKWKKKNPTPESGPPWIAKKSPHCRPTAPKSPPI